MGADHAGQFRACREKFAAMRLQIDGGAGVQIVLAFPLVCGQAEEGIRGQAALRAQAQQARPAPSRRHAGGCAAAGETASD